MSKEHNVLLATLAFYKELMKIESHMQLKILFIY